MGKKVLVVALVVFGVIALAARVRTGRSGVDEQP